MIWFPAFCFFVLGLGCLLMRKQMFGLLVGIEMLFNAAHLQLAFGQLSTNNPNGELMVLFGLLVTAVEAAVALCLMIYFFSGLKSLQWDRAEELHES